MSGDYFTKAWKDIPGSSASSRPELQILTPEHSKRERERRMPPSATVVRVRVNPQSLRVALIYKLN